eukprot:2789115-Karenia_brevis.AAC.1
MMMVMMMTVIKMTMVMVRMTILMMMMMMMMMLDDSDVRWCVWVLPCGVWNGGRPELKGNMYHKH